MQKPIISIGPKEWLTGIAPSAHTENSGIFYKAAGISAVTQPGSGESSQNGLLCGGPTATDIGNGVLVDTPIAAARNYAGSSAYLFILGADGHLYQKIGVGNLSDLRDGAAGRPSPISSPANGIFIFTDNGTKYLYYFRTNYLGRFDLSSTFNDTYTNTGIQTTTQHPTHRYFDRVLFGNGRYVGVIQDSAGISINGTALDLPANMGVTAIADDGVYAAVAITDNTIGAAQFSDCRILFWDGNTSSWLREYPINDPYILSLQRVGNAVIAQGIRGIYQVSFSGGVKKILSRYTGVTTGSNQLIGPALAGSFNQEGYVFASSFGSTEAPAIGMLGAISDDAKKAFRKPILISSNQLYVPSLIETQFEAGAIYVATAKDAGNGISPTLSRYVFGSGNETNVSAQTIYFPLGVPYLIDHIDVSLGAPLASGDSFTVQLMRSESESAVAFGGAQTYAAKGALRRVSINPAIPVSVDEQVSIVVTLNAGAVKIKRIRVYGTPVEPMSMK